MATTGVRSANAPVQPGGAQTVQGVVGKSGATERNQIRGARAPAPPPKHTYKAESKEFQAQIARGLASMLRHKGGSVTLRLTPHALGEVRVRMTVNQARVEARFEPSTIEAQRLLETNLGGLRSALESKGLEVERLNVGDAPEAQTGGGAAEHRERAGDRSGSDARRHAPSRAGDAHGGGEPTDGRAAWSPDDPGVIDIGGAEIRIDTVA